MYEEGCEVRLLSDSLSFRKCHLSTLFFMISMNHMEERWFHLQAGPCPSSMVTSVSSILQCTQGKLCPYLMCHICCRSYLP